jgi:short subunit dehydrogenase-like uncharacterized protein
MQMKYGDQARENGVFVISACGWDSVPCDMGMNFLKENFQGVLSHAETFARFKAGEAVSVTFRAIPIHIKIF